jgi:hypothetical protein
MLLLSDGTVMAQDGGGSNWFRLTPDSTGSYANGTWDSTSIQTMHYSRLYYSSQVLPNGQVFVAGGEYGTGADYGEVYDPVANTWTVAPTPPGGAVNFADSISEMLPDGNVLVAPVHPSSFGGTLIWNTYSGNWSVGPDLYEYGDQSESSWVLLPDTSILTVNALDNGGPGTDSQRYIPSLNQWIADANLPVQIWADICGSQACFVGEEGPAFLLPNGNAFFLGGDGNTAIYTPSGDTDDGSWVTGATIPAGLGAADTPGAMMVNGNILCAVGAIPYVSGTNLIWNTPTYFYLYSYNSGSGGSFSQIDAPAGGLSDSGVEYNDRMLDLPDGTVLFTDGGSQLYDYVPGGTPLAAGRPAIYSISYNADGSLHLTGTLFNGISQGAAYGDDAQMNSNYPLVRFDSGGDIYYGRTFNWSSTGVMTGSAVVSTECSIPLDLPPGPCAISVIANGNASGAVAFNGPVWVDFVNYYSFFEDGSFVFPYGTLAQGVSAVGSTGGAIYIDASSQPSQSSETPQITTAMTIISVYGQSTIGE